MSSRRLPVARVALVSISRGFHGNTTLRVGMASDHRAGTARLLKHLNGPRRSRWRKCRRETVERIITVAMSAPLDVTELQ